MKLVPILMDESSRSNRNLKVIWYEIENDKRINPIDVFIRLNVGKIPLTDAELTKALLLQRDKYEKEDLKYVERHLFEIASEWDNIEYTLQNEEFWYFLSNQTNGKPTHIEFIFDLIADNLLKEKKYFDKKPLKHSTFLILSEFLQDLMENQKLSRIKAVENIWERVTEYFEYFREWFNNRKLFHYIGFLISLNRIQIDTLINKARSLSKINFVKYLESEIGKTIKITKKRKDTDGAEYFVTIDNLNYENEDQKTNDIEEINKILFIHNVHTSLTSDKENARFPFHLYKSTKRNKRWSLEHIHAQNSQTIKKRDSQITWLSDHITSLSNQNNPMFSELITRMENLRNSQEIDLKDFEAIVNDVYTLTKKYSDVDEKNIHNISNLCLVDSITNSQLNNSVFDVKREIIKERELYGSYIPICTRNVFMKSYSKYPLNNAYWTKEDREAYLKNIKYSYSFFTNSILD